MDVSVEDSDDSALISMTVVQKRKASSKIDRNSKQAKLSTSVLSLKNSSLNDNVSQVSVEKATSKAAFEIETDTQTPPIDCESTSTYFKIPNTCPLCLKCFETDSSYASHMKQCAKKRKLTTQQLLSALELQKKHVVERRALGLCTQIVPVQKNPKKKAEPKDPSYELALGIALSKSLEEQKASSSSTSDTTTKPVEKFGLKTATIVSKKRSKDPKKSILKERTKEERQRIVTEKAAVVLLDEGPEECFGNRKEDEGLVFRNVQLKKLCDLACHLWNLGENVATARWYVEDLKSLLAVEEEEVEVVIGDSTPMPPDNIQTEISKDNADEETNKQIRNDEVDDVIEQTKEFGNEHRHFSVEEEEEEEEPTKSDNVQVEVSKLKLPKGSLNEDWKRMVNNDRLSDVIGRTKDCKNFYLHSLVMFVRCPRILEKDYESVFSKFHLSTILIFLEYLYCGTLNGLQKPEVENLLSLAHALDYSELITVLRCLKEELNNTKSEGTIPSSTTPGETVENKVKQGETEIDIIEEDKPEMEEITIVPEDKDLFVDDMVDLTQSSHGSSTVDDDMKEKLSEDESNVEKSYWSFLQHEKKLEEMEEERKREEETENTIISTEMEKIETSMKQQHERMQQILNEFEEHNLKNKLELEKIYQLPRRESNDSATKDLDEEFFAKRQEMKIITDDCIVLSSDSETRASKPEDEVEEKNETFKPDVDFDVPYFDPYDNFNHLSSSHFSPIDLHDLPSQSMLAGDISPISSKSKMGSSQNETFENLEERKKVEERKGPEYFSTPVTKRRTSGIKSSLKKSLEKSKRKKSDLGASRIVRKSLGLPLKNRNSKLNSAKKSMKKSKRKESSKRGKDLAEALTNTILNEFSKSPMLFKPSTPAQERKFVEVTPLPAKGVEITESMTPSPNYSNMGESLLKEHLSKYGLKRSLGKSKAKKILRHIYEELHPILNKETGKIVKMLPSDSPKTRKKTKKSTEGKRNNKTAKAAQNTKKPSRKDSETKNDKISQGNSSKESDRLSVGSIDSLDRSTDYDSDGSEFEGISEPLTQSVPNNPLDLPSAFREYLQMNPDYHQKILLYEPIWLEELQSNLKETFRKHFKLSDLMDYLDQTCITFRSAAQKRNNQKRNEKKKSSPRKKKSPLS